MSEATQSDTVGPFALQAWPVAAAAMMPGFWFATPAIWGTAGPLERERASLIAWTPAIREDLRRGGAAALRIS
ncbi:hypothetical protein [Mycobacterium terramassiliense]|uniref:hypothetical protein n=1 Tax=Mycobacterium terramassiliense TaxID=1841859 RepID=UPI0012FFAAF5|nr:hypothetical protein [Mycobacterium terramassiliense]